MITHSVDIAVLEFFQGLDNPVLDAVMSAFTKLGDHGLIWIAISLLLLAYKPTRIWGVFAGVSLAMTFFIDEFLLKSIFLRERPFVAIPDVQLIIDPPSGFSFPSGHSATAFSVAICLLLCPRLKLPLRFAAVLFAVAIATSRVYLSVHYLTDVVCGSLVGIVCGIIFGLVALHLQDHPKDGIKAPPAPTAVLP
ncbi:MAG: phosphatase PAP2 family protein [Eggerthellaceae bacterium]